MYRFRIFALILSVIVILFPACKKKVEVENEPVPNEISRFIWNAMSDYYLWNSEVTTLNTNSYPTNNDWYTYLNSFGEEYENLFDDLLYQKDVVDKWSWIVDDWEVQEQSFSGISKSMGYDFRLMYYGDQDDIFGYVRYVIPNSPADIEGIERGDIFLSVDGTNLDANNYYDLLFEQESYQLGMGEIVGSIISPIAVSYDLTAVVLQEDPIHMAEIIDIGDGPKTAYLVYNAFTSDFDNHLNEVFGDFKAAGAERLILDLRYNGGGSIRSAVHLASMIYSTDNSKVFGQTSYNSILNSYFLDKYGNDYFYYYFTDVVDTTTVSYTTGPTLPAINNLGLDEIYIIATGATASASEMIINGLEPHIDVIQVGKATTGKYVGSFTIKDYYTHDYLNTDHKWALQPITLKIANSEGTSDFVEGLAPDVVVAEDVADLLPFGDEEEPLLAAVIDYIFPSAPKSYTERTPSPFRFAADSRDFKPRNKEMYIRYPKISNEELNSFREFK